MGEQLAMPGVSLEQRVQPDPVILTALASHGAPMGLALTVATAATLGACVLFYDWYEHPEGDHPVWTVFDVPASMHAACNAHMTTWTSDDSWFWIPKTDKVPKPRRLERIDAP